MHVLSAALFIPRLGEEYESQSLWVLVTATGELSMQELGVPALAGVTRALDL